MSNAPHNRSKRHGCPQCSHCSGGGWTREDKRHSAQPPDVRGRRGHPVIGDIPGLPEWMEEQFREVPRPSFREIEARLKTTPFWTKIRALGFRTGKSTIHTYWVNWYAEMARKRVVADYAAARNEDGKADDVLEIEGAITSLANEALLLDLRDELNEGKGVTPKAGSLIDMHRKLQSSSARREAERRAAGINARKAYQTARAEIVAILEDNPEVSQLVLAAIDKAEKQAA